MELFRQTEGNTFLTISEFSACQATRGQGGLSTAFCSGALGVKLGNRGHNGTPDQILSISRSEVQCN